MWMTFAVCKLGLWRYDPCLNVSLSGFSPSLIDLFAVSWIHPFQLWGEKSNILFLNGSDCTEFIVCLCLGNAYTLVTVWGDCPLPAPQRALCFCFLRSFIQALSHPPLFLSPLTQRGNSFKREAPGQFPSPSFAACHVVYSAQLFKKCWISTMAFTGALSTFVWSNLGWMRWVPEQGELSSVHYHTADWPSLTLYFPLLHLEQPGALLPRECLLPESRREFGAPDVAPGACWQPAVEGVSDKGTEEQRDQSELGECPQFSVQSGRRVVKREEEREGGHSERGCRELCVFYVILNMFVHLSDAKQQRLTEHTTCCLIVRVWNFTAI